MKTIVGECHCGAVFFLIWRSRLSKNLLYLTITLLIVTACSDRLTVQRKVAASEPLETLVVSGDINALESCVRRSGMGASVSVEQRTLYVVPEYPVAEIKVIESSYGELRIEHRASGRTIWGTPLAWGYLNMVKDCAAISK